MNLKEYDVIIVGAGPSGSVCALHLARKGLRIAIVDKDFFPREKTCGDGLTGYVLYELNELGPDYQQEFLKLCNLNPVKGMKVFSPGGYIMGIYGIFRNRFNDKLCYICKRKVFDNMLFERLRSNISIDVYEGYKVIEAQVQENGVMVSNGAIKLEGRILVGADGANSFIKREIFNYKPRWDDYYITIQAYFQGLEGVITDVIEAHLPEEILPGGLWIFPMGNGIFNVGMGVPVKEIRNRKLNIGEVFNKLISENPALEQRFKKSQRITEPKVKTLPLGSKIRAVSSTRVLLLGDAVSVVNPLTGEGIGEAMNSGRIAAKVIHESFNNNDFSDDFLKAYDKALKAKFSKMIFMSKGVQLMLSYPFIINRIAKNYSRNEKLRAQIEQLIKDPDNYRRMFNPLLYLRMVL